MTDRSVVVGVDDSAGALDAVRWAAAYAREVGAAVELVHASTVTDGVGAPALVVPGPFGVAAVGLHRPARSGDRLLAAASAAVARIAPELTVAVRTASDTPVAALVDASTRAGLLVVGSQDRNRWVTLFDSVAARVLAAAHSPVVVVRGDADPAGPVVVAVDDSESGEPALRFAFREAARRRSALVAVHAWQPPLSYAGVGMRSTVIAAGPVLERDVSVAARRALADTMATWRAAFPDVAVRERVLQGPPDLMVAAETSGAALAVVGSRGRGPVAGLLLGSTSQALIHTSKCPVAVVRDDLQTP